MEKQSDVPEEQAFQEGMQDNSVKITDDNNADPGQDVVNRDPKITNAETHDLLKEDHEGRPNDGEAVSNTVDNEQTLPDTTEIPETYSTKKAETQDASMKEDD